MTPDQYSKTDEQEGESESKTPEEILQNKPKGNTKSSRARTKSTVSNNFVRTNMKRGYHQRGRSAKSKIPLSNKYKNAKRSFFDQRNEELMDKHCKCFLFVLFCIIFSLQRIHR